MVCNHFVCLMRHCILLCNVFSYWWISQFYKLNNIAFFEKRNKLLLSIFHVIHVLSSKLDHKVGFFFVLIFLLCHKYFLWTSFLKRKVFILDMMLLYCIVQGTDVAKKIVYLFPLWNICTCIKWNKRIFLLDIVMNKIGNDNVLEGFDITMTNGFLVLILFQRTITSSFFIMKYLKTITECLFENSNNSTILVKIVNVTLVLL